MHICPACERAVIPAWRGLLIPRFVDNTCRCSACQTLLRQQHGAIEMVGYVPVAVTAWLAFTQADIHAIVLVMWSLFLPVVAGVSLWALTIRYKAVDETRGQFTPHTTQLRL